MKFLQIYLQILCTAVSGRNVNKRVVLLEKSLFIFIPETEVLRDMNGWVISKYNNVKIVISEVYASFVLQCTVSGR